MTLALVISLLFFIPLTIFVMSRSTRVQPLRVRREEVRDAPSDLS